MVVQEGGFEKAARVLAISQSAVSQRVRQLEDRVGQILLSRGSPPQATPLGRVMVKHYRQVKLLEDNFFETASEALKTDFTSLAIGVNADSLATWLPKATQNFLAEGKVVFDLHVDDQDETHRLLKNGKVVGCISTSDAVMQGCRVDYLGCMIYRLVASPDFATRWFPAGVTREAVEKAPGILFNRKDMLNQHFFRTLLGDINFSGPTFFVPSSESFVDIIVSGLAYGLVPDQQSQSFLETGELVELTPELQLPVQLYWHCWSIDSDILKKLTHCVVQGASEWL